MEAALRALERCCVCSAYFPPRQSAKKRRSHIDACARLHGLSVADTNDCLLRAAAHLLREERERQTAAAQARTLYARHVHRSPPSTRVKRLATIVGRRPDACSLIEVRAAHAVARAHRDALLDRYCAEPAAGSRSTDQDARGMLAQLERHAARLAPPRHRRRRLLRTCETTEGLVVPTSDDDDDDHWVARATRTDTVAASDDEETS